MKRKQIPNSIDTIPLWWTSHWYWRMKETSSRNNELFIIQSSMAILCVASSKSVEQKRKTGNDRQPIQNSKWSCNHIPMRGQKYAIPKHYSIQTMNTNEFVMLFLLISNWIKILIYYRVANYKWMMLFDYSRDMCVWVVCRLHYVLMKNEIQSN